jgi:hypothetical protein
MIGDQLSKQEDRVLHRALESVVRTQFPNPRRIDCPGTETLRAIVQKRTSMRDPAIDHVGHCSPCFVELTNLRRTMHRRNVWKTAGTAAAVLVVAVLAAYFVQEIDPRNQTPLQPRYAAATIDLRNASTARSIQPSSTPMGQPQIELPRATLSLIVELPIGSEAGLYEAEIRAPSQVAVLSAQGQAEIDRGVTRARMTLDTRLIQPGPYEFRWRLSGFDWHTARLVIR